MRLDRSKLPHNMTPDQRADFASDRDVASADRVASATIKWLTGGWTTLSGSEKAAMSSGELV